MNNYDFPKDLVTPELKEKLEALIESHKKICKLYENARERKNSEMADRLYAESKQVWKSIEDIKKEISKDL
ncbi:conserved hypothetical protein [metagenome]